MKAGFTFLFLLFASSLIAQTGAIKGSIANPSKAPLAGITIRLENTPLATATDGDGNFFLSKITPGKYTLVASGIGYQGNKQNVEVTAGNVTTLTLELDASENALREVVITGKNEFETITSTASRTNTPLKDLPQSIQFVNRTTMDEQQLYRVDEALKNVAGINLASPYGAFIFRGFQTYSTSFLTNGMKGSVYPEGVMPVLANVERVDVLRGPSAILYGQGALGGNINLVTKQPKKFTTAHVSVTGGSFDLFRTQADVTGSLNKSKSVYFLAGVGFEQGGKFIRNFDNQNLQLFGTLNWELSSRTSWQINATYNQDRASSSYVPDVPIPGNDLFALPYDFSFLGSDARYKGDSYQFQSQFKHQFSSNWSAHVWVGFSQARADRNEYSYGYFTDSTNTAISRGKTIVVKATPVTTVNLFSTGRVDIGKVKNTVTTGIDLNFENSLYPNGYKTYRAPALNVNQSDQAPFIPDAQSGGSYYSSYEKFRTNTYGVYLQDQISFSEKWKAVAGIRFNHYFFDYRADSLAYDFQLNALADYSFESASEKPENTTAFIPRVGVVFQPSTAHSFYLDYNTGFTPQYLNSKQNGGPFPPEKTHQLEIGWKGDFLNHRLVPTVAFYQITKNNVLARDPADTVNYTLFRTVGQVRSRGVELTLTGSLTKNWQALANYSYNHTIVTKSDYPDEVGSFFGNTPQQIASLWTTYRFAGKGSNGLQIGFGYRYTGERYIYERKKTDTDNDVLVFPSYTVADAFLAYTYRTISLQLNVNNLFNQRYAQGSYAPGSYFAAPLRNFLVTMRYSFR